MDRKIFFLLTLFAFVAASQNIRHPYNNVKDAMDCHLDPDMCRNASELIISKGYPCEEYVVQTEDGFLLTLQRIPHGKSTNRTGRGLVFLQHGLLGASTNWIANMPSESLGFILADAGYDVWLGNLRGNTYSRQHTQYKPDQEQFWKWSWDEMAQYDLPSMINFALRKSKQKQLHYIGHSQGTLIAFAHLSKNPDLFNKIKMIFALGPVATVGHIKGALRPLSFFTEDFADVLRVLGVNDFMPSTPLLKILAATLCEAPTRVICSNVIFLIAGYDTSNFNMTRMPVYVSHTPAGTSVQNMVHFSQMVRSGKFQMFDYGCKEDNMAHYGQNTPPLYDATEVKTPVALFSGGKDWLADPQDVKWLQSQLPNVFHHEILEDFNHLDFIWGIDTAKRVYNKIVEFMQKSGHTS